MKQGRIFFSHVSVLEKEHESFNEDGTEIIDCLYSKNYAYTEEEVIGSNQRFEGYKYYRYPILSGGILGSGEELSKLPIYVK